MSAYSVTWGPVSASTLSWSPLVTSADLATDALGDLLATDAGGDTLNVTGALTWSAVNPTNSSWTTA